MLGCVTHCRTVANQHSVEVYGNLKQSSWVKEGKTTFRFEVGDEAVCKAVACGSLGDTLSGVSIVCVREECV